MEFKEIKKIVENELGKHVSKVDVEGPKIVLYTKDPKYYAENPKLLRQLATLLKKKILLRADVSAMLDPERATKIIKDIVPKEANVSDISFNPFFRSVYIEAEKLGLVIGKGGEILSNIWKQTGWNPIVLRKSQIEDSITNSIRKTIMGISSEQQEIINLSNKEEWEKFSTDVKTLNYTRQEILREIGLKIYRKPLSPPDWLIVMPLGGASEVGRSSFLLKTPESNILLDCGINVAAHESKDKFPDFRAADMAIDKLDAVIISHAHLDHCGFVPFLYKYGYKGPVYCTEPTRDLMTLLLLDALDIWEKHDEKAPYSANDVREVLKHTITLDYDEVADITPDMKLTFYNAGHILGSAIVHIHIGEGLHNLVYTGDLKFGDASLLEPAHTNFTRVETVIIESTYGGKNDIHPSKKEAEEKLINLIKNTVERNGKVLIPVFAVGRSQEVMITLEKYKDVLDIPIYLDGMILETTAIHTTYPEYLNMDLKRKIFNGENPFTYKNFHKVDEREDVLNSKEPVIVLAPAGMMTGGPVLEYFKKWCNSKDNTLIFVGYQAAGSLGRILQEGAKEVNMMDKGIMKSYEVKIQVETVEGFSGHADRKELLGYLKKITPTPKRILTIHGDKEKCRYLAEATMRFFNIESYAPRNFDGIRLI